jgi:AcrR family transcriptional regulator
MVSKKYGLVDEQEKFMKTMKGKAKIRKGEIFDAALKCFNKKGYYKTSLDDIAKKIGITKAAIYYYFTIISKQKRSCS